MTNADDPIAFELFRNAIFSIADEMALTIFRTTYSGVLKDNMDYSTAFCDGDGKLVAQGLTLPGHLGAIPTALEVVVARYRDDMAPGDVFAMNDPFEGGMHLPDIFVFKPLYFEGERIAFEVGAERSTEARACRRTGVSSAGRDRHPRGSAR
jgi:N-methylhydantoinase B